MVHLLPTILYSCIIGITLLALLAVFKRPNDRQNVYLKGLLLLLLIHSSGELFTYSGAFVYAPDLMITQLPFRVLLGSALYFYTYA